jgi:hypothetical protein
MKSRVLLATLIGLWCAISAYGQVTFEGCRDIRGIPVASIRDDSIGDVAKATIAPDGSPVILYNVGVLHWLQPQTRLFIYAHECAHHALGHNFGTTHPLRMEQDADCWGIRTAVTDGQLSADDVAIVQADIARVGVADWMHLPGPQRAINLSACLGASAGGGGGDEGRECELRFRSWKHKGGGSADFSVLIDGEEVATLSNEDDDDSATFTCPTPGTHSFRLADVTLVDRSDNTVARGAYCQGSFSVPRSKTHFTITLYAFPDHLNCAID